MARPVCIIESIPAVVFFEIGDHNRRAVEALRNIRIERLRSGKRKGILFKLEIEPATNGFKVTLPFPLLSSCGRLRIVWRRKAVDYRAPFSHQVDGPRRATRTNAHVERRPQICEGLFERRDQARVVRKERHRYFPI
jgi:hypothetical protein